jgi:LysM repeat protein
MRLKALVASFALAAILAAGGSTAQAQSHQKNQTQAKKSVKKQVQVVVNEGDTLSSIANQYKTTFQRLYDANTNINDPDVILVGQKIRVPDASEQLADRPIPVAQVAALPSPPPVAAAPAATSYQPAAAAPVAVAPVVQAAPVAGCGDNSYANFIYSHESGCRTTTMSANGCYGIGQACPASKIAYCGADYACQNAYFTAYAGKYGGWAGAYAFWVSHGWW